MLSGGWLSGTYVNDVEINKKNVTYLDILDYTIILSNFLNWNQLKKYKMDIARNNETQYWNFDRVDIYSSYLEGFILTPVGIMGIIGKFIFSLNSYLRVNTWTYSSEYKWLIWLIKTFSMKVTYCQSQFLLQKICGMISVICSSLYVPSTLYIYSWQFFWTEHQS